MLCQQKFKFKLHKFAFSFDHPSKRPSKIDMWSIENRGVFRLLFHALKLYETFKERVNFNSFFVFWQELFDGIFNHWEGFRECFVTQYCIVVCKSTCWTKRTNKSIILDFVENSTQTMVYINLHGSL